MTGMVMLTKGGGCGGGGRESKARNDDDCQNNNNNLSLLAFFLAALRKSMVSCRVDRQEDATSSALHRLEISWPTNVQHIAHVTFDRFNGFLGLPVEFEVEIPCRVPSARFSDSYLIFCLLA
ncbi:Rho GTPase-activating protein 2 [Sarracenia purpurea var. burkii]